MFTLQTVNRFISPLVSLSFYLEANKSVIRPIIGTNLIPESMVNFGGQRKGGIGEKSKDIKLPSFPHAKKVTGYNRNTIWHM